MDYDIMFPGLIGKRHVIFSDATRKHADSQQWTGASDVLRRQSDVNQVQEAMITSTRTCDIFCDDRR